MILPLCTEKQGIPEFYSGFLSAKNSHYIEVPEDLARLVGAWHALPQHIRAAIGALLDSVPLPSPELVPAESTARDRGFELAVAVAKATLPASVETPESRG